MTADTRSLMVPKLRFAEFRDAGDWMTKILGNQGGFLSSLTGKTAKDFDTGDATFIPYMNVFSNTFTNIFDLRSVNVGSDESQSAVAKGDVFFTISSEVPEEAGMSSVLLEEIGNCYLNSFCALFRFDDGKSPNPVFLGYLLRSTLARAHLSRGAQGATRYNIPKATFRSLPLQLPSGAEQQKIADCLGSLDDLIAAEGRKLEALRQHKQGLMQQLFPQAGETVPQLRFPEFEDAGPWEQLTIDEAAELKNGYAFKSDTYVESGDFQIVTIGNVQEGRLDLESTKSITTLPRDIQNHQILKPADILVSMTGNVGRVCLVPVDGLLLNQRVGKLIPRRIDHDFFFQMLNRKEFRSAMQLAAAGGAQGNVSAGGIKSFVFARPVDPKEQRGIADCLSTLDTQIAAQVRKLDALRQHKQGLLQQLFPSTEGT